LVEKVVRRASDVELAVLKVAADVYTGLHLVTSMADRDHIRVCVDVLFEELRVAAVGAKSHAAGVHGNFRNAGLPGIDESEVCQVTRTELIEQSGAERVHLVKLEIWKFPLQWVGEAAGALH